MIETAFEPVVTSANVIEVPLAPSGTVAGP